MASSVEVSAQRQRLAKWTTAGWFGWALALCSTFASSIVTPLSRGLIVGGMDPINLLLMRLSIAVALIALLWPLQTLTIIVLSVLFLNERMTPMQWVGGALVLSSAVLAMSRNRT